MIIGSMPTAAAEQFDRQVQRSLWSAWSSCSRVLNSHRDCVLAARRRDDYFDC